MIDRSWPVIAIDGVIKSYGHPEPLRVQHLTVNATDRLAIAGLDEGAAEILLNLITGASLPEEGTVRVGGQDTRAIVTDQDWLASLDRFGLVTRRAVLIGKLPIAANLALPLTLSIDPMSAETRASVETLAETVRLPRQRIDDPASELTPAELIKVHLARALALGPQFLLLEHPTTGLADAASSRDVGRTLRAAAAAAKVGWLALTDDREFTHASGSARLRLHAATGEIRRESFWARFTR